MIWFILVVLCLFAALGVAYSMTLTEEEAQAELDRYVAERLEDTVGKT